MKFWQTTWFKRCAMTLAIVAAAAAIFWLGWFLRDLSIKRGTYTAVWEAVSTLPEPRRCALCGSGEGMRYHAPCLVNLSTGEVGEMVVYTQHPHLAGEIAPEEQQQTGTFCFFSCAGLHAVRDTCVHTCKVSIPPENIGLMYPGYFCKECRVLLAETEVVGYLLVDLYDLDHIQAYPVRDGEVYTIRDYVVSMAIDRKTDELDVDVQGLLYRG